jgi:hypothetical protein
MTINVAKEVATLRHMTVSELRDRYQEVFGEDTNARNKQWLIKRIAWKRQRPRFRHQRITGFRYPGPTWSKHTKAAASK